MSPGLLFHMDMKTIAARSRHGHYHYFVGVIDDNSHRSWVYFMRKKTEALFVLKTFINEVCIYENERPLAWHESSSSQCRKNVQPLHYMPGGMQEWELCEYLFRHRNVPFHVRDIFADVVHTQSEPGTGQ